MDLSNAQGGRCVVCNTQLTEPGFNVCLKCGRPCQVDLPPEGPSAFFLFDAKSLCCGADIRVEQRLTCSAACHEAFVGEMEAEFGAFKKVVDAETGLAHRVPTKDIVERGLRHQELRSYPLWVEPLAE